MLTGGERAQVAREDLSPPPVRPQGSEMAETSKKQSFVVALDFLPPLFPIHLHSAEFWEQLGRTVATFWHLEEVLGKAIFALTATVPYDEAERQGAFDGGSLRWSAP